MHYAAYLPPWIHEFWQWHVDMFAALNPDERLRVQGQGSWIVFPYGDFDRLDSDFTLPLDPLLVPVPADSLSLVASLSSTMVYNSSGAPPPYVSPQPEAGPSTSTTHITRSQTRARSKAYLVFFSIHFYLTSLL